MEPTTYVYSKFYGWIGILLRSAALIVLLYLLLFMIMPSYDIRIVLCFVLLILLTIALLIYFLIWRFVPMINGAIALELDEEKLQCYITGKTIYWRDVVEISVTSKNKEMFVTLEMVDGSDNMEVPVDSIAGSNTSIYNKMQEYFARTL
jgi:hypothetical protein